MPLIGISATTSIVYSPVGFHILAKNPREKYKNNTLNTTHTLCLTKPPITVGSGCLRVYCGTTRIRLHSAFASLVQKHEPQHAPSLPVGSSLTVQRRHVLEEWARNVSYYDNLMRCSRWNRMRTEQISVLTSISRHFARIVKRDCNSKSNVNTILCAAHPTQTHSAGDHPMLLGSAVSPVKTLHETNRVLQS